MSNPDTFFLGVVAFIGILTVSASASFGEMYHIMLSGFTFSLALIYGGTEAIVKAINES